MKYFIYFLLLFSFYSCTNNSNKKEVVASKQIKFSIICDNERYLFEDSNFSKEYFFDTIYTTKGFYKHFSKDASSFNSKIFRPFFTIDLDTVSIIPKLKISISPVRNSFNTVMGSVFLINNFCWDSVRLAKFYESAVCSNSFLDKDSKVIKGAILSYDDDSIKNVNLQIKIMAQSYIDIQKLYSKIKFKEELCNLNKIQLDSLKKLAPFCIRFMRSM